MKTLPVMIEIMVLMKLQIKKCGKNIRKLIVQQNTYTYNVYMYCSSIALDKARYVVNGTLVQQVTLFDSTFYL